MTRSLEPDEESDEEFNYDEMDSQCDYLTKDHAELLRQNSKCGMSDDALVDESYSLIASVNQYVRVNLYFIPKFSQFSIVMAPEPIPAIIQLTYSIRRQKSGHRSMTTGFELFAIKR